MNLMRRRREMMKVKPYWDYVFTRGASGYYTAIPVSVKAGQTIVIEFSSSTNTNGYIYYCDNSGVISPNYQRTSSSALKAGGTMTKEIFRDGILYFGTNNNGSQYYNFRGDYIKVHIE